MLRTLKNWFLCVSNWAQNVDTFDVSYCSTAPHLQNEDSTISSTPLKCKDNLINVCLALCYCSEEHHTKAYEETGNSLFKELI